MTTITDHIPLTPSAVMLGRLVILAGACVMTYQLTRCTQPGPPQEAAPPDTITKERTITRTDTVTEAVPETVIRYDTVQTTDTLKIPVPAETDFMGVVPPSPLDLTDDQATLTYFDGERWIQQEYDVPRDTWRLDFSAHSTALQSAAVAMTSLQVRRRTALGWVGVGPSYGAVVTEEVTTGVGVTVSFSTTLYSR